MSQLYFIGMERDGRLTIVDVEHARFYLKDNLFGPYRTFNQAVLALENAEIDFFYILYRVNAL